MIGVLPFLLALISSSTSITCYLGCYYSIMTMGSEVIPLREECTSSFVNECTFGCAIMTETYNINNMRLQGNSVQEFATCAHTASCASMRGILLESWEAEIEDYNCREDECFTELCNGVFNMDGAEQDTAESAEEEKKAKKDKKKGKKGNKKGKNEE